ncbi:MAG TPA: hypothetical protein VHB21_01270, partial [Minicystis sp.]|nr:hypothetical protein [Minicystis sp.]
ANGPIMPPEEAWLPGVYVTAVSQNGCTAGTACQIFLQQDLGYATLGEAEKHSIKIFASKNTSMYFTGIHVGDQLNVYGHAWRYDVDGQNELLIQVAQHLTGCAKVVSQNNAITPVPLTTLASVVSEDYEAVGPLFVKVVPVSAQHVHGKPKMPDQTFAIFDSSIMADAGPDMLISLSPFFMTGAVFANLPTNGMTSTQFDQVTGVYGLFVPPMQTPPVTKYKEIYVRTEADYAPHNP